MPDWGFSASMRRTKPYGLTEWLLEPGKVITDPIHGDIFLTRLEQLILDTPPMQRLRRVRQLGTTHLAYPGATHTRFAHCLGSVRVVQTLLDKAVQQGNGNHPIPDLFKEWEAAAEDKAGNTSKRAVADERLAEDLRQHVVRVKFDRQLAEATVLARLGALLHDVGHLPFGHTIEDDLRLLKAHDQGNARLDRIWTAILSSCERQLREDSERDPKRYSNPEENFAALAPLRPTAPLFSDLRKLILSSKKDKHGKRIDPADKIKYPFVADMVGNTICADLLDYLERDHVFTGLPLSLGKRFLSSFYITPVAAGGIYRQRMALVAHRDGRERRDVITEILKHLRYRYELQERVLVHHTKLAADAMVGKMFERWADAKGEELLSQPERLKEVEAAIPPEFELPDRKRGKTTGIKRAVGWELENLLLQFGDDGVLEHVADEGKRPGTAGELAGRLLERNLYKPLANAVGPAAATDLFEKFGGAESRRNLEQEACRHAGIDHDWQLVLWIPDPDMRLKLAELLVDDGRGIAKFKDKFEKGSDIYADHKALWTISVFVHPDVSIERARSALAKLGQSLGVSWSKHTEALGKDPAIAPEHLAGYRAMKGPEQDTELVALIATMKSKQLSSRGGSPATQDQLDKQAESLAPGTFGTSDVDQL